MELTGCSVDLARGRVARGDQLVALTSREAALLRYLVANPSRVVSRNELLAEVWGYADAVVSRACDNTVRRLREKIEADPAQPDHLLTVHGEGYRFEPTGASAEAPAEAPTGWWTDLGSARVDLRRRLLEGPSGPQRLTEAEARLLDALIRANGAVVERSALTRLTATRGRAVDALIGQLRDKLEVDRARPRILVTHRGGGYRLERSTAVPDPLAGRSGPADAVRRAHRTADWVLVLGPAGIGKSHLARHAVPSAVRVDLAGARTADELAGRVAAALGLTLRDLALLGEALAHRTDLVVLLDDLESSSGAAALVDRWREQAPGVRWLGTARARVGARNEVVVELGPLDLADAVALFVARAHRTPAGEPIRDLDAVRQIVDRLDRLPLAIELAAARTSTLGLNDLRQRLSTSLLVRPAGNDPRHHSLSAVVAESLAAVPREAVAALHQLALFRSGFFVDDAEALLGEDAIDLLQVLRDHSLLYRRPDLLGCARFDTWQGVREVLAERPSDPDAIRRHAAHLACRADDPDRLDAFGREAELRRTIAQVADLRRAALDVLPLDPDLAARCAWVAGQVHVWQGPHGPGLALVDPVIAALGPTEWRARLRVVRGLLLLATGGDAERARAELEGAAVEARAVDAPAVEVTALRHLGFQRQRFGDPEGARAALEPALQAARRAGLGDGLPELLAADLAGAPEDRLAGYREAARIGRSSGARGTLRIALGRLARDWQAVDHLIDAQRATEELYALVEPLGLHWEALSAASMLSALALKTDDPDALERWGAVVAELAERVGSRTYRVRAAVASAAAAAARGRFDDADAIARRAAEWAGTGEEGRIEAARTFLARSEYALRSGDPARARQLATAARAGLGATSDGPTTMLALCAVALGDLDAARAHRLGTGALDVEYRHAFDALLAAAEGRPDDVRRHLDAMAAEFRRLGRPGDTDAERIGALLGSWAADRLATGG